MRIAIDARAFWWTGVGRYIRNIAQELLKNSGGHTYTFLVPQGKEKDAAQELHDTKKMFSYVGVEPSYYSIKEQTTFLRQLNALDVDLVHFAHFNVPLLYTRPFVVTIHDITRFIFSGQKRQSLSAQFGYEWVFIHAVKRAKKIITVSNTTAHDMEQLPISHTGSVHTILEGVDSMFLQPISELQRQKARLLVGTNRPFLLFVGVWMSHKNLFRLLAAYEKVKAQVPNVALVITGKPVPGYSNLLQYVRHHQLEADVLFPGFVPHELLPALYAEAQAFVFPSLYEGFGLPPLEAASCHTPVIASNVSSMPELLAEACEYVNPESEDDIARGILRVATDSSYRKLLVERGVTNAARFSWERAAQEHIRVYENALQ